MNDSIVQVLLTEIRKHNYFFSVGTADGIGQLGLFLDNKPISVVVLGGGGLIKYQLVIFAGAQNL